MPQMDMSDALTNPYTLDTFNVIRQLEVVSNKGRGAITPTTKNGVVGVVVPAGSAIARQENFSIQPKGIVVITTYALRGESKDGTPSTFQPDLVVWNGNQYVVKDVMDYSRWASGFIAATCALFDAVAAQPPVTHPMGGPNA